MLWLLAFVASPALAWDFRSDPLCTIEGGTQALSVTVTFDPASGLYRIDLDRADGWPESAVFALVFEGAGGLTITTNRHVVDGTTLSVTDTGFGNVLRGLEAGATALAVTGDLAAPFALDGADDAVAKFRACSAGAIA